MTDFQSIELATPAQLIALIKGIPVARPSAGDGTGALSHERPGSNKEDGE